MVVNWISQSKYAKSIVKKFGLESASSKRTSVASHVKISKDDDGIFVDQCLYISIIGSPLYLTASRPDIASVVGICARYQEKPKNNHLLYSKGIVKYICGTRKPLSLVYFWY